MSEVLSQSQIDALINSMKSGTADNSSTENKENKYKKYDFYSPKKFTKDKLKLLSNVYENYARLCSSRINSIVRISSFVNLLGVEEQRYYEFSNALNDNDTLALINIKLPNGMVQGPIILHCTNQLMLCMVDRMIGGTGEDAKNISASYVCTDIEILLYKNIVKYLVSIMADTWVDYIDLEFSLDKIETNPGMMQKIGRDETTIIVVLETEIDGVTGKINICLPSNIITSIFNTFESKAEKKEPEDENSKEIFDGIKNTSMEMYAELGKSTLLLKDLYTLQVGDVINLNKPKDSDVSVYIGGELWFKGELGKYNKNMAVKINEVLEKKLVSSKGE